MSEDFKDWTHQDHIDFKTKGQFGYYRLYKWWMETFTDTEREMYMSVIGGDYLINGRAYSPYNVLPDYECKRIGISAIVFECLDKEYPGKPISHLGFKSYIEFLFRENNYRECIEMCQKADKEGWCGNWRDIIDKVNSKYL